MSDPYVTAVIGQQGWVVDWWRQTYDLLADPTLRALPEAELREAMLGACRRLLSLPRRAHPMS